TDIDSGCINFGRRQHKWSRHSYLPTLAHHPRLSTIPISTSCLYRKRISDTVESSFLSFGTEETFLKISP
ncbi:hypothetical protein COCMIDRAFT_85614, partial [Bipolaris oryzae ATCC 44560]